MKGYDEADALAFIAPRVDRKHMGKLAPRVEDFLRAAIALDLQYMEESGAVLPDGSSGADYDDDAAFEFILDGLTERFSLTDTDSALVGTLLDDYMEAQEAYMEKIGMLDWE